MAILANSYSDLTEVAHQFPTSRSQKRIHGSALVRHNTLLLRCHGELDCAALEHGFREVIERYEVLRTAVVESDAGLAQLVLAPDRLAVTALDLSNLQEQVRRRSAEAVLKKFYDDCHSELLFRVMIVRESAREHLCALRANPLIADEFTLPMLLQQVDAMYRNRVAGGEENAPAPELQFADYCVWQSIQGIDALPHADRSAWTDRLSGYFVSTPVEKGTCKRVEIPLSDQLARRLREFSGREGAEPGPIVLAALASMQSGKIGRDRLLLGAVDDGRYNPSLQGLLGPLSNMHLLRWSSQAGQSFPQQASALAEEWKLAQAKKETPYETVRSAMLKGDLERLHWIDIAFAPAPRVSQELFSDKISVSVEAKYAGHPDARMTLRLYEQGPGTTASLESDSVEASALQRLLGDSLELLERDLPPASNTAGVIPALRPVSAQSSKVEAGRQGTSKETIRSNEIVPLLASLWAGVFGVPAVGPNDNFFDLGGHSLLAVKLAARIEKSFSIEIPLHWILEYPTIAEFAKLLETGPEKMQEEPAAHTLVPLHAGGSLQPLYWIPGGRAVSVMALREVSRQMGGDRSVYGLESRLPQPGESFLSVPDRARIYVELIRRHQPKGPYLLAGFCMGGMVALEIAQQLLQAGQEVGFLGMVQASVPGFPDTPRKRRRMDSERRNYMLRTGAEFIRARLFGSRLGYTRERRQAVLDRMASLMMGWVSTSSQLPEETQSANNSIMRTYRPSAYAGKIHIYLAKDCYESVGISAELDPRQRWSALAQGGSATFVVPGNHSTILTQPHARNLAEAIAGNLPRELTLEEART